MHIPVALTTSLPLLLSSLALTGRASAADDLLAITFAGDTYLVDSTDGSATPLGSTAHGKENSMAVAGDGTVYVMASNMLLIIDPVTGNLISATPTSFTDVTGLAWNPADELLYAVQDGSPKDVLWTLDPGSLQTAVVGKTGVTAIQSLAFHPDGTLYAYDIGKNGMGLVSLDLGTGFHSDPFPGIGSQGDHQYLTFRANGGALVGAGSLFALDLATGAETLLGTNGLDLRGLDFPDGGQGEPLGTNYCGPANFNSSGQSALIAATGSPFAQANFLVLHATQLPIDRFGYFLNSQTQGFTPFPPGSQGNLCLAGAIGRHVKQVQSSGSAGEFSIVVDLVNLPTPSGPHTVVAGETWNFQCWFRDDNGGPTSNFTDGVSILFQ